METRYLIIGNAAGGIGAVEGIRSIDRDGSLTLISSEPYEAYSRPLIAPFLTGERDFEGIRFRPAGFYARNSVQAILGTPVTNPGISDRVARLADGREISWERMLLATGGVPIIPDTPGKDARGVFTFNTLDDARKIKSYLDGRNISAVVIGGGLIGLSVSEALKKCGIRVTIVELKGHILNTILDEEAGRFAADAVRRAGVNLLTGITVTEISRGADGTVSGVTLNNGIKIATEMVVFAIGVRPSTGLVAGTDIKLNRGIRVDRRMATNMPGVFACGDAAETYDFSAGEARLSPIWPNAYLGGRTAGINMAGCDREYPGGTVMNSIKYFGLEIVTAGITTTAPPGCETVSGAENGTFRKLFLLGGRIAGMVLIGNIEKAGLVFSFMKDNVNVDGFKKLLVAPEINEASLPAAIYRGKLKPPLAVV